MPKIVTFPHGLWGNDAADWPGTGQEWAEAMHRAEEQANTGPDPAPAEEEPPKTRYHLMTPDELGALPRAGYRIKDVLPANGVGGLYGAPKSGKTFLTLDCAAAITEGRDWFGYRTRPAPVVYVGLEGEAGLAQRWEAYDRIKGQTRQAELRFITAPWSILASGDLVALADAIRGAGCVDGVTIIDTLNAASPGADENASADMSRIIGGAKRLQREVGGLVLLIHHSGKDASRGLRGHSSLTGAVDVIIEVSRDESGDRRHWRVERGKDIPESDPIPFALSVVELGADEDGDMLTSCVVQPRERTEDEVKRTKPPSGGNMRIALDAISVALKASHDYAQEGAPDSRPCVTWEQAMEAAAARMTTDDKHRRQRAQEAITSLVAKGHLSYQNGWMWLP
ncbi:MAG: AAA family ATPase [Chromatiaceae bacterium]|nr:AAA family ATPase [Chromatiaceae bacterium]